MEAAGWRRPYKAAGARRGGGISSCLECRNRRRRVVLDARIARSENDAGQRRRPSDAFSRRLTEESDAPKLPEREREREECRTRATTEIRNQTSILRNRRPSGTRIGDRGRSQSSRDSLRLRRASYGGDSPTGTTSTSPVLFSPLVSLNFLSTIKKRAFIRPKAQSSTGDDENIDEERNLEHEG
ncbi:uncharacterized protein LOC121973632 isoform X2 [Zingiber officinale]|uniref:uncharacterized protein LOC121973632 isoform X2 n=1 Tax=Zingiber officinale TaxID=94328 RepID=UPI001C4CF1ED|nr:uncharacterized protein LOC121973632 isoform X2 [Zingiber officinale]